MSIIDEKKKKVDDLKSIVQASSLTILLNANGVSANDIRSFRKGLFLKDSKMRVSKNTLIKLCLDGLNYDLESSVYSYPTALVYTEKNVVELAKSTTSFAKEIGFLTIKGAILDGQAVDASVIHDLSKLPPKDVLIGKLIGSCQSPIQGLLYCLSGPITGLVSVLNNIADKKQKEV